MIWFIDVRCAGTLTPPRPSTRALVPLVLALAACGGSPRTETETDGGVEVDAATQVDAGSEVDGGASGIDGGGPDAATADAGSEDAGGVVGPEVFTPLAAAACVTDADCPTEHPHCTATRACARCVAPPCESEVLFATSFDAVLGPTAIAVAGERIDVSGTIDGSVDFGGDVITSDVAAGGLAGEPYYAELAGPTHVNSARLPTAEARVSAIRFGPDGMRLVRGRFEQHLQVEATRLTSTSPIARTFFLLVDAEGDVILEHVFDTDGGQLLEGDFAPNGDLILAGYLRARETVTFGSLSLSPDHINGAGFLVRLAPDGTPRYGKLLPPMQRVAHLRSTADDGVLIAGELTSMADFGGGLLTNEASYSVFVVRYDASGEHVFSHRYPEAGAVSLQGLRMSFDARDGVIALSGPCHGSLSLYGGGTLEAGERGHCVVVLDDAGRFVDGAVLDSWLDAAVAVDPSGRVFAIGTVSGAAPRLGFDTAPPGLVPCIVEVADGGLAPRCFAADDARITAVTMDHGGDLVLTGAFTGALAIGAGLTSAEPALWLARLLP